MLITAGVAKQTRGKDDHHTPYDPERVSNCYGNVVYFAVQPLRG